MASSTTDLGQCPFCGTTIRPSMVLIEYDVNGETRVYAECAECTEPVQPQ